MEVIRAATAGFCMGVVLALQKLDELVENCPGRGSIFTLGPIIHNPQVMAEYADRGVNIADSPKDIPPGTTAVIRAHGVPLGVKEDLRQRGVHVVDATCPKVKKAQLLIEKEALQGRMLILYGEKSHPEVKGLLSYAQAGAFLFDSKEKLDQFILSPRKTYCLAAQTTQDRETFDLIVRELAKHKDCDLKVLQTICDATRQRQEEAVRIAREMDFMVVVGGFNSGNIRRLVQVVAARHIPVLHVETVRDLPLGAMQNYSRIGLTAGASTPKGAIDEIHSTLAAL
jgi:4-hydroxy-3-methylbut-2-enyl diphosphate reductase